MESDVRVVQLAGTQTADGRKPENVSALPQNVCWRPKAAAMGSKSALRQGSKVSAGCQETCSHTGNEDGQKSTHRFEKATSTTDCQARHSAASAPSDSAKALKRCAKPSDARQASCMTGAGAAADAPFAAWALYLQEVMRHWLTLRLRYGSIICVHGHSNGQVAHARLYW